MAYRTRVFIDFWNFTLNWQDRAPAGSGIDWPKVPAILLGQAEAQLQAAAITDPMVLEETLVYASYNPKNEGKLKGWLDSFLDRQPGFRVNTRERKEKPKSIRCTSCGEEHSKCAKCDQPFTWAPEKGVDTAIVTDLLALGSEGKYDVALLLSSDADHIPAVEWVQGQGLKVINATWTNHGFDLEKTCWGSFRLDPVVSSMVRPNFKRPGA